MSDIEEMNHVIEKISRSFPSNWTYRFWSSLLRNEHDISSISETTLTKIYNKYCGLAPTLEEKTKDQINPDHYKSHPSGVECIQVIRHMNFNCGNAVKYIWRNGLKDGNPSIQELKKAAWYLNDEIKRLENDK